MEEKKNNKGLIWLIVILIVLVLILLSIIIYQNLFKENKTLTNNDNTSNTTTTTTTTTTTASSYEQVEVKPLQGTFTLSNNKYSYTIDSESLKIYLDNKLVYSDIDYQYVYSDYDVQYFGIDELGDYVTIYGGATACLTPYKIFDKNFNNKIIENICIDETKIENDIFKYSNDECDYNQSNPDISINYEFNIKTGENKLVNITERNYGKKC